MAEPPPGSIDAHTAYEEALLRGVTRTVAQASAVRALGQTTVNGRPATAFSFTLATPRQTVTIAFAANGQVTRMTRAAATGARSTALISTTAAIDVARPPPRSTVALSALPARDRQRIIQIAAAGAANVDALAILAFYADLCPSCSQAYG
jgi:hypothetical protein